LIKSFKRFCFK